MENRGIMEALPSFIFLFLGIFLIYKMFAFIIKKALGINNQSSGARGGAFNPFNVLLLPFTGFKYFLGFLFIKNFFQTERKAEFMGNMELRNYLNSSNKGLVIDGDSKRLSSQDSFKHCAVIGGAGSGKTSSYIIPNVLSLDNCSVVITDLSGDIYQKTSQHLKNKGFKIVVLQPNDISSSDSYNPLLRLRYLNQSDKLKETKELAETLFNSVNTADNNHPFFSLKAQDFLHLLIMVVVNQPNEELCTLYNLSYIAEAIGGLSGNERENLDNLVLQAIGDNPHLSQKYVNFVSNIGEEITLSILETAKNVTSKFIDENIAKLTATNTIDFHSFRDQKTAFYIIIPQHKMDYYSFLLNVLYKQLFSMCMDFNPTQLTNKYPIYFLLDEFGHLKIPEFSSIVTTIRQYNASITIILQSISQLEERYGRSGANTILNGGMNNQLYLTIDTDTAQKLQHILGENENINIDPRTGARRNSQERLMLTHELIQLTSQKKALFIIKGHKPILVDMIPYFQNRRLLRATREGEYQLNSNLNSTSLRISNL